MRFVVKSHRYKVLTYSCRQQAEISHEFDLKTRQKNFQPGREFESLEFHLRNSHDPIMHQDRRADGIQLW